MTTPKSDPTPKPNANSNTGNRSTQVNPGASPLLTNSTLVVHDAKRPIDPYAGLLIENLVFSAKSLYVRQFLDDVLKVPELHLVMACPVRDDGGQVRLLVEVVQPLAETWQNEAKTCNAQIDAVYAATLLHAMDYCMYPALCGKYDTPFALYHLVRPHLDRLREVDRPAAYALQLCMHWDRFDAQEHFTDWLNRRMDQALQELDLASF